MRGMIQALMLGLALCLGSAQAMFVIEVR